VIAEWCKFNGARLLPRSIHHDGWEMRIYDGPASVNLVLVQGMGHRIAGGHNDRLPHQSMRAEPDAVEMALAFFADLQMPQPHRPPQIAKVAGSQLHGALESLRRHRRLTTLYFDLLSAYCRET
jgi:hypothetical protein